MRLTRQAALAIALVAGLLAALGAWIFIGQQQGKVKAAAPVVEMVGLPMPVKMIPAWTELRPDMFEVRQVKKEQVPVNVVTDLGGLDGRVAVADLTALQPVGVGQVAERSKRLGVAWSLNEGLRGMSISLDVVGAVGDFVQPGNHVDVMCSFEQDGLVVVRTIVQDVTVLAMGQTTSVAPPAPVEAPAAGGAQPAPEKAAPPRRAETPVTLALTPTQAQIVLTADKAGDLRLALRPTDDRSIVPLPNANSWSMVGAMPAKASARPSVAAATPQPGAGSAPTGATTSAGGMVMAQQRGAVTTGPRPNKPYVEVIRGGAREYIVP